MITGKIAYCPYRNKEGNYLTGLTEEELIALENKYNLVLDKNYYKNCKSYVKGDVLDEITKAWLSVHPIYK